MYITEVRILFLICFLSITCLLNAADKLVTQIHTDNSGLIFRVAGNGRLYQSYLGRKLNHETDIPCLLQGTEAYITRGMGNYFGPVIHILRNGGDPSPLLKYVSHEAKAVSQGVNETITTLGDDKYPVTVKLHCVTYPAEDIIKTYTEASHKEKKPVVLHQYASNMLHLNCTKYYLTGFSGGWAHETNISDQPLEFGKRVLDTKLGARANMFTPPFFRLSLDQLTTENCGEVLVGTLGWADSFCFTFGVDDKNELRIISGINLYASEYYLPAGVMFRTPDFHFAYSTNGKGEVSRDFHDWARRYQLRDRNEAHMTLLNNWETTYFDFNEEKLIGLIGDAAGLGVDMFLLDDGWFVNRYPHNSDHQGLGGWDEMADKLPNGIGYLVEEATKKGIKFDLWVEPGMVNPKGELYEKHKDRTIHLPNRDEYYFRNQLVLDLSNPKVQGFVFRVVDDLMAKYPGVASFRWDCDSPITSIYSSYLKEKQSHLYISYVHGLYNVLERIKTKYPGLPMMLCSGSSGRIDYETLRHFIEFWPSSNADPIERLSIRWEYSQLSPAKILCAHVTT